MPKFIDLHGLIFWPQTEGICQTFGICQTEDCNQNKGNTPQTGDSLVEVNMPGESGTIGMGCLGFWFLLQIEEMGKDQI